MIRVDKVRGLMAEKRVRGADIARGMNIAPKTFYEKMKKGVFDSDEIDVFKEKLEITDAELFMNLFFAPGEL